MARQQEQVGHERAIFCQLQKLKDQEPSRNTVMALPAQPSKPPQPADRYEGMTDKVISTRSLPEQYHAQSPHTIADSNSNSGVTTEAQPMKVEVGGNDTISQGGSDPFWRCNPISQATQVCF